MASRELAQVRQKLADLDERCRTEIKRLLRDPELRKILRYPNATVSGDHYVLPVAVNHRHKLHGVVHRTSSTGETVFIEPAGIANLSTERVVLKGEEDREIRRILRQLSAEVGQVAQPLTHRRRSHRPARLRHRQGPFQPRLRHDAARTSTPTAGSGCARPAIRLLEHLFRTEPAPTGAACRE